MKTLQDVISEQRLEVSRYRKVAENAVSRFCSTNDAIVGALLSGSTARGDARSGPFGFMIDLVVIVKNKTDIDLEKVFGPDIEPYIPYHCISFENLGFQIELATVDELKSIRSRNESEIFAKQETMILLDKTGFLKEWKQTTFALTPEQKKVRALMHYFRYQYLTNSYHQEKWTYRDAWIQLAQNGNEACECYCSFLYCINSWFIPRKDWLVYLTYELIEKPEGHERFVEAAYRSVLSKNDVAARYKNFQEIGIWMTEFCKSSDWIE